MRINEIINEDEWQRITPADLPTPVATSAAAEREAAKKSNMEYWKQNPKQDPGNKSYDTSKLPWWRKSTTNPAAQKTRKDIVQRGDIHAAVSDPERISKASVAEPLISGDAIRLDPNDPNWKPAGSSIFGGSNLPREREQTVRDYRPFRDEYSSAAGKINRDTKDVLPQVSPGGIPLPGVRVKRPQA